jgi:hypothetical protein
LLAGARGFYLSLLERVFHVKILCLHAVISFSFFVIAYRFYNRFKPQVLEIWERELTIEYQVLRQVHADFLYGSPVVGLFSIACCI